MRHRKRRTTITINKTIIKIYCNKSYVNVATISQHSLLCKSDDFLFFNQAQIRHCDHNTCCLRCDSKTSTDFLFFLQKFGNKSCFLT